ncbi:MAG: DUF4199 domain-containing protein [Flavobacteriales bacterium]|nr:DUF4199 domain-containing protein [Flavobacteriales bacterium]
MENNFFKKPPFWYGLYYGIASVVFFTLIYAFNFAFFGRFFMLILVNIVIVVAFMIMGGMAHRKYSGGYLRYMDAVKALFYVGLIGYIINMVFSMIFVNYIDTEFNQNLQTLVKESTMEWMQSMNVPDEKIDEAMENIDNRMKDLNTPMAYVKQFFSSIAMSILFAFICAFFVRKNPPENYDEAVLVESNES